jgi:hypothetical protein
MFHAPPGRIHGFGWMGLFDVEGDPVELPPHHDVT